MGQSFCKTPGREGTGVQIEKCDGRFLRRVFRAVNPPTMARPSQNAHSREMLQRSEIGPDADVLAALTLCSKENGPAHEAPGRNLSPVR